MNITIERYKYTARTTIGKMYINGEYFLLYARRYRKGRRNKGVRRNCNS